MELLPCGHYQHSEAEEKGWASTEFQKAVERQKTLCKTLFDALKKKGKLNLGPYPPVPFSYETQHIYETKQHFGLLRKRLPRPEYLEQVEVYERAHRDCFDLPPCRRGKTVPLLPSTIPGLLKPSDLPTPRTGGRHPSQSIQQRNSRIAELVKAGNSHLNICLTLDGEKYSVPGSWRNHGFQTWRQAYRQNPDLVHSLISKASTKKLQS